MEDGIISSPAPYLDVLGWAGELASFSAYCKKAHTAKRQTKAIFRTTLQPAERRSSKIEPKEVTTVVPIGFVTRSRFPKQPCRHGHRPLKPQCCHLIGTPSLTGAGLTLSSSSSFAGLSPCSSTLVSRCRKLLSFTGLPLCPACSCPPFPLPLPLGPFGPGEVRCGIFSGRGCSEPIEVTPTSEALPALERA